MERMTQFPILSLTFLISLGLIVVSLLGGGFEVKTVKIPVLGTFPRVATFVTGLVLFVFCLFVLFFLREMLPKSPPLSPK
jgi:hypothetical protein